MDKNNNELTNTISTESSGSSQTRHNNLKTCIIRLTELSNQEREQWMTGISRSTSISTPSEKDESSTGANDSRYNMRARPCPSVPSNRLTGRKQTIVNYKEQGIQDSGCDSDYEINLRPPQPLDNKSFPSASRIATERVIETNRANKHTKRPNDGSLPAATVPLRKSSCTTKQNKDSKVLPEATAGPNSVTIPDKTSENTPDGTDETPKQSKTELPDTTSNVSPDVTKAKTKGVFKTKTITIRRSKDPHTFKCSVCSTRTATLCELNAHFIQNHRNVDCDICGKSFQTPASLRKHQYSHIEESELWQCCTCDKHFPFESQLKSHRHMHQRIRYYRCASANCD